MMLCFTHFSTAIGEIAVVATEQAVVRLFHGKDEESLMGAMMETYPDPVTIGLVQGDNLPLLQQAKRQVIEYLSGQRRAFDLPIEMQGAPFQWAVWRELQRIPYGEAIDYSELAKRAGNAKAVRAAGSSCGANPLPLIVPCHRVLQKGGALGGFGWGLDVKAHLLALERGEFKRRQAA